MAKNDNLKDFLTDVADAIREKKGTTDLINPQDFSAEIASIQSGGGAVAANDVTFYDYDGTILHSYTKDEFLALTELPPLPTREGLICQEWNWDFAEAVGYVAEYGCLDIGATYITDDGKTKIFIELRSVGLPALSLYFSQTTANGVIIDWGDGSPTETIGGTGNVTISHSYNAMGEFIITMDVADGCSVKLGHGASGTTLLGNRFSSGGMAYPNTTQQIFIGKNVAELSAYSLSVSSFDFLTIPKGVTVFGNYALQRTKLKYLVIPKSVTTIGTYAFYMSRELINVIFSHGLTSLGNRAFSDCTALYRIVFPNKIITLPSEVCYGCYALRFICLPDSITTSGGQPFYTCYSLYSVSTPKNLTNVSSSFIRDGWGLQWAEIRGQRGVNQMFYGCTALHSCVFPNGCTSINSQCFSQCYDLVFVDFSKCVSIPTLSNVNAFETNLREGMKIVVPDALYDDWITATNWSSSNIVSKIIKKSEWDALNA